jgi:hypothetical protein
MCPQVSPDGPRCAWGSLVQLAGNLREDDPSGPGTIQLAPLHTDSPSRANSGKADGIPLGNPRDECPACGSTR